MWSSLKEKYFWVKSSEQQIRAKFIECAVKWQTGSLSNQYDYGTFSCSYNRNFHLKQKQWIIWSPKSIFNTVLLLHSTSSRTFPRFHIRYYQCYRLDSHSSCKILWLATWLGLASIDLWLDLGLGVLPFETCISDLNLKVLLLQTDMPRKAR